MPELPSPPIPIPHDRLSPEALQSLIEEYVSRDGTNVADVLAMAKVVRRQLDQGNVIVVYDSETETTNIVLAD